MQIILTEAEYNELVSAKQTLEKVVANIQDDLFGTQKSLELANESINSLKNQLKESEHLRKSLELANHSYNKQIAELKRDLAGTTNALKRTRSLADSLAKDCTVKDRQIATLKSLLPF